MTEQEQRNKEVVDLLTTIQSNFLTINDLLKQNKMTIDEKKVNEKWLLQPLYENTNCSAGIVVIKRKEIGPCEEHVHPTSIEYLIVTNGRLMVSMMNHNFRICKAGECIAIPANTPHYSTPMEDNTELIYITIPKDNNIPDVRIVEDIQKEKEKL